MAVPAYRFDPSLAFPELPKGVQSTLDASRGVTGITLVLAYLLAEQKFTNGSLASMTMEQILAECEAYLESEMITLDRACTWAESILLPPEATLTAEQHEAVPRTITKGDGIIELHPYQVEVAAWSARRRGSLLTLGCGVGKSASAVVAAIAAVKLGHCNDSRCYIVCPINAISTWESYLPNFKAHFKDVAIMSADSVHKWQHVAHSGGAVIFDEAHKFKNMDARRGMGALKMRHAFDWSIVLTATLMHTGTEATLMLQDVAVPGLSRFCDKWAFGAAFDCIVASGYKNKKTLVKVPSAKREAFGRYLARGVRSLDYQSPEVANVISMPNYVRLLMDTWTKPAWARDLIEQDTARVAEAKARGEVAKARYLWPPDMTLVGIMAGTAVALGNENRAVLAQLLAADPDDEELQERARKATGIPTFLATVQAVMKLGRFDMILERSADNQNFTFLYAPGSDVFNPAPGPKLLEMERWLLENPKESVVIGAQGVPTLNMAMKILDKHQITYRLIRGGVKPEDRKRFNDEFQAGEVRVMLAQQLAGSESVQLTKAAFSMLLDHDLSPITYEQFIHRTFRQGQERDCTHIDMSFCSMQTTIIKRLIAGAAFDLEVRKQIESEIQYTSMTQNPGLI